MPTPPVNLDRLIAQFPKYQQDPSRIRTDVMTLWRHRQSLIPKRGKLTLNTGQECDLLMLEGTFSIVYRGVEYFTPIEVFITENYPSAPPMCYIRPTSGMSLKVGHRHVDQGGLVYLPYLHEWSARTHNLVELIANMSSVFGAEPPLFATPPGGRRPSTQQHPPRQQQQQQQQQLYGGSSQTPHTTRPAAAGVAGMASPYVGGGVGGSPTQQHRPAPVPPPRPNPEQVRKDMEMAVTVKLQSELQAIYATLGSDMDKAFDTQCRLEDHRREVEASVEELSRRKKELERLLKVSQERELELDTYLQEKKKEGEPSVDDLIEPKDALSEQMLRLVAENAALEDALYYLDLGVTDSVITVEVFLKEIRRLARKQFVARATMKKVERAQEEKNAQRARFDAEQQRQQAGNRASGGGYPHLPPQYQQQQPSQRGGYMGGPPPGYSPPTDTAGVFPGATGYNNQPAAGTAGLWGGAAASAGRGAGNGYGYGYGYPSNGLGGAQASYTQRR
ncbi:unnamed protein product [Pylaiella littoralis]